MAQSFNHISVSLGEAERQKDGKPWSSDDYSEHQKHYHVNQNLSRLNTVFVSVNGKNESEIVNGFLEQKMLKINQMKIDDIKQWNDSHRGQINPKTKKEYKMKSVDKRQMFAVGKYKNKGKRQMPYDTFKKEIERGNARAKNPDTLYRMSVLQQYAVGIGNTAQWHKLSKKAGNADLRKQIINALHSGNSVKEKNAKNFLNENIFKPFLKKFEKENPSLHVVQAVVHLDETNPHMQFTVLPFRNGKEHGGLGSTGYTTCLKHDHKDISKTDTIGEFYRQQHNDIRDIISNINLKGHVMKNGKRPGSHKSMRVDKLVEFHDDKNRQMKWLGDQNNKLYEDKYKFELYKKDSKNEIDVYQNEKLKDIDNHEKLSNERIKKRENDFKNEVVLSISLLNPKHKVPKENLKNGEEPKPVENETGKKQHSSQSLKWLIETLRKLVNGSTEEFKKKNSLDKNQSNSFNDYRSIGVNPDIDFEKIDETSANYKSGYKSGFRDAKLKFGKQALADIDNGSKALKSSKKRSKKSQSLNSALDDFINQDDRYNFDFDKYGKDTGRRK